MKKIIIIGSPGTGKSTLGKQLAKSLSVDIYHLDALFWQPNWQMSSREEQQSILYDIVKKDSWIIDGNYSGTLDIRFDHADTIIYLKRSRVLCIFRAIKRYFMYRGKTRPDMQEECFEKIDWSFVKWIWQFPKNHEPLIDEQIRQLDRSQTLVRLTSNKDIECFFNSLDE